MRKSTIDRLGELMRAEHTQTGRAPRLAVVVEPDAFQLLAAEFGRVEIRDDGVRYGHAFEANPYVTVRQLERAPSIESFRFVHGDGVGPSKIGSGYTGHVWNSKTRSMNLVDLKTGRVLRDYGDEPVVCGETDGWRPSDMVR